MINILISGDFCPINRTAQLAKTGDYKSIFNDFITVLEGNDLNITNLECPLLSENNEPIEKTGPSLKADENSAKILKYGNFHLATLANNHIMDYGINGLKSTMKACKKENIAFVGAGFNRKEASKPFYKTIKNKKIAILNFAENEFSTTHNENPGANPLDPVSNFYDIKEAREKADFVFVIVHGGHEHYQFPSPRMQETYKFFIDIGADAVIGHHPHCYSGFEIHHEKPIFYSLGNFIFDRAEKRNSTWNKGYAVKFTIEDSLMNFALIPFIQGNENPGISIMDHIEFKIFEEQIRQLNLQLGDSKKIELRFKELISSRKKNYLSYIEPYSNKYLLGLYNIGLLPSFISERKKRLFLNLIRCEAHRDLLLKSLKD